MSQIQTTHYCPVCERQTLHVKERSSNVLHLLLSIVTCGLWLVVWLMVGASNAATRTRCSVCGSQPGVATVRHAVRDSFASQPTQKLSAEDDLIVNGSQWLPPSARPPR